MKPTDTENPEYFHRVVDCQYACPAHTPVPEYIRLIAAGRYEDAYMINWESNVFRVFSAAPATAPANRRADAGVLKKNPSRFVVLNAWQQIGRKM